MIRSLSIQDRSKVPLKHLQGLKIPDEIDFSPGVNIIVGPNGSGKSTIMQLLAQYFLCYQGGVQKLTRPACEFLFERGVPLNGYRVDHDGGPVMFFDSARKPGLDRVGFDYDFMTEGIQQLHTHGSHGEQQLTQMTRTLHGIFGEFPAFPIPQHYQGLNGPGTPPSNVVAHAKSLEGTGVGTVLLDEPENSLQIDRQYGLFLNLVRKPPKAQVIVVTHSMFAYRLPGVNYIETKPGFLKEARRIIEQAEIEFSPIVQKAVKALDRAVKNDSNI